MSSKVPSVADGSSERDDRSIGIAIAAFNAADVIADCLRALAPASFTVVLFDDGSSDDTAGIARDVIPEVDVIRGDGEAWWAGGTRRAVERCFDLGCSAAVMLNPDVVISAEDVRALVRYADSHSETIVAPLVVDSDDESRIAWAGSRFGPLLQCFPVRLSRYIAPRGSPVSAVGSEPYPTDEAHGRGVVVTREVYERIGGLDYETFPHYGADVDYSHRARAAGIHIVIVPAARAKLRVDNTGMTLPKGLGRKLTGVGNYLFRKKHGDGFRVLWQLNRRHLPIRQALPSFVFVVGLNVFRRLAA